MGFQELLDPSGTKRKEFDDIVEFLERTPRPKIDYRWLSHVDFLGLDFLRRLFEIQTSYMLLFRSFAAMAQKGFVAKSMAAKGHLSLKEVLEWSSTAGRNWLYELYCSYPDRALMGLFVDFKLEGAFVNDEFARRVADKPFTAELVLFDWGGVDCAKEVEKF